MSRFYYFVNFGHHKPLPREKNRLYTLFLIQVKNVVLNSVQTAGICVPEFVLLDLRERRGQGAQRFNPARIRCSMQENWPVAAKENSIGAEYIECVGDIGGKLFWFCKRISLLILHSHTANCLTKLYRPDYTLFQRRLCMTPAVSLLPRLLGNTGLEVSPLCIGCAPLGNMPETFTYSVQEEQALETIRAIFKGPINFIDTSALYGESEQRLGRVLRESSGLPSGFVLATKADRNGQTGEFSGEQMRRSIERSLQLLGLDQIQILYLHDPEHISFEEAMAPGGPVETLQRCQEEGLFLHLGVAGGPLDLMTRFVETDIFALAISHNRYTLLNREADSFWDTCAQHGVAAVNAAPYGGGILAKGPAAYPRYMYAEASPAQLARARELEALCNEYGVPLAAAALQFSLCDPRIASTIIGITRPERLAETITLAQYSIPAELWAKLV
jgi:D-threo-aldose 1-dehydrogenase